MISDQENTSDIATRNFWVNLASWSSVGANESTVLYNRNSRGVKEVFRRRFSMNREF